MNTPLQRTLENYAKALIVPRRLLALHPRKQGNSGNAAALAPAITLGVISAFEGFVEEFIAVAAYNRGSGLAHVAKAVGNLNNPDVAKFQQLITGQLGVPDSSIGTGFALEIWEPPVVPATWWVERQLNWTQTAADAEAWMQVRHCLTHGLTSGWRAENWPAPLKTNQRAASQVLRGFKNGKHSLVIHGAISCARIYVEASRHLADIAANHLGEQVDSSVLPEFHLYRADATAVPPTPGGSGDDDSSASDEGEEPGQD